MRPVFTERDQQRLRAHGVSMAEVERQLSLFRDPPAPLNLVRPCVVGDGIRRIEASEHDALLRASETARAAGRLLTFVPASGAASRMFRSLLELLDGDVAADRAALEARAARQPAAADALRLFDNLDRFAFHDALATAFESAGKDLGEAKRRGNVRAVLEALLSNVGLDYGNAPKGLLPFHRYNGEARTALEEHLVEAAAHASDDRVCRLHFTVSPEHRGRFEALVEDVRERYESRCDVRYEIAWSSQKPSTDTVAVDADGNLFRNSDGDLLLRPGGHGALLENMNDLRGDVVLIKNIDNVAVERELADCVRWKRLLVGYLCDVQARVFAHVRELRRDVPRDDAVVAALRFARDELGLEVPGDGTAAGGPARREHLHALLHRPLRVCGMVRNTGEPGGGPAWVRDAAGHVSRQIVERAQIDPRSPSQQDLFNTLTHFNPVDLVCAVRDVDGTPFDLRRFVDPNAVIFADKSSQGRALRALERPGLWNGGMAHWITLFVEVPISTFNPVKTFLDLLRPAHQPA